MEVRRSLGLIGTLVAGAMAISSMATASGSAGAATGGEDRALESGAQGTAKHTTRPQVRVNGVKAAAANPYLGLVPDPSKIDWSFWKKQMATKAEKRYAALTPPTPFVHDEEEPGGDARTPTTPPPPPKRSRASERARTSSGQCASLARTSRRSSTSPTSPRPRTRARSRSRPTPACPRTGRRHDLQRDRRRPARQRRDGTGDFDFFKVRAATGEVIERDTDGSEFDTVARSSTTPRATSSPSTTTPRRLQSELGYVGPDRRRLLRDGRRLLATASRPIRSTPGVAPALATRATTTSLITVGDRDTDYYAVRLRPATSSAASIQGRRADIAVHKPDGAGRIGSTQDASFIYPARHRCRAAETRSSSYVAEEPGWYAVSTAEGEGAYDMQLEVYRPGSESAKKDAVQTMFLDFDGARVNTAIFGGAGQSPRSSPLLVVPRAVGTCTNADRNALIDRIVATVKENISTTSSRAASTASSRSSANTRDNPTSSASRTCPG